jgi:hypothetical protein
MAPRWRELREAYPGIVAGMVLAIAVLLLTDLVLAYKRVQYGRELARMRASMTETERRRVDAIAASEENRLAIAAELARRQALGWWAASAATPRAAATGPSPTWTRPGDGPAGGGPGTHEARRQPSR